MLPQSVPFPPLTLSHCCLICIPPSIPGASLSNYPIFDPVAPSLNQIYERLRILCFPPPPISSLCNRYTKNLHLPYRVNFPAFGPIDSSYCPTTQQGIAISYSCRNKIKRQILLLSSLAFTDHDGLRYLFAPASAKIYMTQRQSST